MRGWFPHAVLRWSLLDDVKDWSLLVDVHGVADELIAEVYKGKWASGD